MTRRGALTLAGLALVVVFAADQASKWWVLHVPALVEGDRIDLLPVFSLELVRNQGVTFGLLHQDSAWGPFLLAGAALAVVGALAVWLWRAENKLVATALGAIAGGAVGNVMDRLRFGWVVDFVYAHWRGWNWYVFNVADSAIVCGVAALVLDGLLSRRATPGLRGRAPPD